MRVSSPVIANGRSIFWPRAKETRAVAMVTPAEGPSFGVAPSGT